MSFSFWVANFQNYISLFWNLEKLDLSFKLHFILFQSRSCNVFKLFGWTLLKSLKSLFFHLQKYFKFSQKSSIKIFDFTLSKIHLTSKKNRWKMNQINYLLYLLFLRGGGRGGGKEGKCFFSFQYFDFCLVS